MAEADRTPLISIVAPMWNEEQTVDALLTEVMAVVERQSQYEFEVLLVDDGSHDGTVDRVQSWIAKYSQIRLVELSRNFGHQAAITAGVFEARGDAVVVMDSDLQDPPAVVPELIEAWSAGADVVYAVRRQRQGDSLFKRGTARMYYRVLRSLSDTDIPADTGDFRLMSRRVVETLRNMPERDRFMRGMVAWVGFEQVPVYFDRDPRHAGESKYPLRKMIRLALAGIVGFSDKPLYLAVTFGFVVLFLAVIGVVYLILSLVLGLADVVRGWTSVVVSVMFFSAVQLIFMGVIGLYISRIFVEAKQRPLYLIKRDSLRGDGSNAAAS